MGEFFDAILKPFRSWTVLLGILVNIIPILNFVVIGYALRTSLSVIRGNASLPSWQNPLRLWWDGLVSTAAAVLYGLPGTAIIYLVLAYPVDTSAPGNALILALLAGAPLILLGAYVLPAVIIGYAESGWRAIFDLRAALSKTFTWHYGLAWLLSTAWTFILSFIAYAVLQLLAFAGNVVDAYLAAQIIAYPSTITAFVLFGYALRAQAKST